MEKLMESVGNFFKGGDHIPWCDPDIIAKCEVEASESSGDAEKREESLMRLAWALVHSRHAEQVNRGIAMLQASLTNRSSSLQAREKIYLLAVGYYRTGDYAKSRQLVEQCLEMVPDWRQALTLKKAVEDKIAKDGVIGMGIAATAVGLLVGGIAAIATRRR